jgi:alcohol dehydrogenase
MRAALYPAFRAPLSVEDVAEPAPATDGVVIEVRASGLCRSDWHGWMGHDPLIVPPHVPGHELAGVIAAAGREVRLFAVGDRVTVPFVVACGSCPECRRGDHQVCSRQQQPGFSYWGSFAEYVAVPRADLNLVRLGEGLDFVAAASLGCRFATAWRAVASQGRAARGTRMAVFGCGGVGLSAVMIGVALGAEVLAVDVRPAALELATRLGAAHVVDACGSRDASAEVVELTGGGADLSLDAFGSEATLRASLLALRRRGRHVQVGLLAGTESRPRTPMDRVIGWELELLGSHGMPAHAYPELLELIAGGRLDPTRLVAGRVDLARAAELLPQLGTGASPGITVIDRFTAAGK